MAPAQHQLGSLLSLKSTTHMFTTSVEVFGHTADVKIATGLEPGLTYSLYILTSNPTAQVGGATWSLESFGARSEPLDQGEVASFELFPAADFQVVNLGEEYSNQEITVQLTCTLPSDLHFGDSLLVQAPMACGGATLIHMVCGLDGFNLGI
eukprot:g23785.t1